MSDLLSLRFEATWWSCFLSCHSEVAAKPERSLNDTAGTKCVRRLNKVRALYEGMRFRAECRADDEL